MIRNDINNEDQLVQLTFVEHLEKTLGWEIAYAYNVETLGREACWGGRPRAGAVVANRRATSVQPATGPPDER